MKLLIYRRRRLSMFDRTVIVCGFLLLFIANFNVYQIGTQDISHLEVIKLLTAYISVLIASLIMITKKIIKIEKQKISVKE